MKNVGFFKKWLNLAKPSKKYMTIDIIAIIIRTICLVIAPIFFAKLVTSLTSSKYNAALIFISIYYGLIIIQKLVSILKYNIYSKLIGSVYLPLQRKIIHKITKVDSKDNKKLSKEKLLNIYHHDALTISVFADILAGSFSDTFRVILTLIITFIINKYIAIVLLIINVINFFIYSVLAEKQAKANLSTFETTDEEFEAFSKAMNNRQEIENHDYLKKEFYDKNIKFIKAKDKHSRSNSLVENYYAIYNNIITYLLILVLILLLYNGSINLTLFLILVPYITSVIDSCSQLFSYITILNSTNLAVDRVKLILDL